jgi:hypothetical protein
MRAGLIPGKTIKGQFLIDVQYLYEALAEIHRLDAIIEKLQLSCPTKQVVFSKSGNNFTIQVCDMDVSSRGGDSKAD